MISAMEERDEQEFFNALHEYIRLVVKENPSGPVSLNVTESSARSTMVSTLNRIINARVQKVLTVRERERSQM